MKKLIIKSIFVLILFPILGMAQSPKFQEGKIVYSITYSDMDLDPQAVQMLPTETHMFFKDNMSRVEMNMGMGTTVVIANGKTGSATTLMDMMGHKISMTMNKADMEKVRDKYKDKNEVKINYTEGTKTICGFSCKRAEIVYDESEEPMEVYYTDDITAYNANFSTEYPELKGFPLQYTVSQQGMTMKLIANKVSTEKLDKKLFEIPEGYKETKPEDLQKMFGGQ